MRTIALAASALLAVGGVSVRAEAAPLSDGYDLDVQFEDCTEYVGIGLVPFAAARALVPAAYTPVELEGNAILVVRVSECGAVSVDGAPALPGRVAQVGINVAGLDASADINNYTLFYVTDSGQLGGRLTAAGVPLAVDAQLGYGLEANTGAFASVVDAPRVPLVDLSGNAVPPTDDSPPTTFTASWWVDGRHGRVRMRTEFPDIRFSGASVLLTTDIGSDLESLIGTASYGFALLDSYNAFETAHMEIRVE